jgi:predicted anti-sigma-YlaC factor YlaD
MNECQISEQLLTEYCAGQRMSVLIIEEHLKDCGQCRMKVIELIRAEIATNLAAATAHNLRQMV